MLLKAVRSQRRFEQVAEQISKFIKKGKIKSGERLPPERELAKQLEVSRPTVREAMIALEISGLVEVRVGSGIYVLDTSHQSLKIGNAITFMGPSPLDLLEARQEIETANVALAAQRIEKDCLEQLEQALEKMLLENMEGAGADREFHLLIAKATGNSVLETVTANLWDQQQNSPMWTKLLEQIKVRKLHTIVQDDHNKLLDCLRRKDSEEAQVIMREHLNHARSIYFDLIDEEEN